MVEQLSAHRRIAATLLILGFWALAACNREPPDLSGLPRELTVLKGASDVRVGTNRDGSPEVFYIIQGAPYPAAGTTSLIRSHLQELGWSPLTRDWLNPENPLEWEFGAFIDGRKKPEKRVHQWFGQWTNGKSEVVLYILRYESAISEETLPPPDNSRLLITATYISAPAVQGMRSGIKVPLQ
jgi:hypothetical protein